MKNNLDIKNFDIDVFQEILDAYELLKEICIKTEIRPLAWLSRISGINAVGKFENQQITGSFKFRGAYNRLFFQDKNRSIIAASAGNHALAVAEAAKQLEIKTTLCIPTNASQLKRNRLSAYPHIIAPHGSSLEEATEYALNLARIYDWDFISPYNDIQLIEGQGSLGIEFLKQVPDLDTLIIPVGGGGLISGVSIVAKKIKPNIKIVGVEPETYSSVKTSLAYGINTRVVNYPTFADGLAVNLEQNSITLDIIKNTVDEIFSVTEEELAAAVLALLYHESQLVEASGAAGLAAVLAGKIDNNNFGKLGIIFSGGNITTSNLTRIMHYPFTNTKLTPFLNMFGERLQDAIILKGIDNRQKNNKTLSSLSFSDQFKDSEEDVEYLEGRFNHIKEVMVSIKNKLSEYINYCTLEKLNMDESATETFKMLEKSAQELLTHVKDLKIDSRLSTSEYNHKITENIQKYRSLLHLIMGASMVLDWRSASYGQSWDTMFFDLDAQGNPGVNYNRYESNQLKKIEAQMAEVLALDQRETGILMTSSGMSAYNLIENYLIRYVLEATNCILIPQYIYFETDEQISKLKGVNLIRKETHDTQEILKLIKYYDPKVIFLDPLTNTRELRMTDVEEVIKNLANTELNEDKYFVIDGSLVSGELDPFSPAKSNPRIHILYYDSCSKYLQLGLDIAMGGLIAFPAKLTKIFERLRRNTGAIMYDSAANIFPKYDRNTHKKRMKRFARNAILIDKIIKEDSDLTNKVNLIYPMSESHPDYEIAQKFNSTGGLITFEFQDEGLMQRDSLNSFIEIALKNAKKVGISLTKGVSFGFSIPRISAAAAMAENSPPFLRLSVGDRSYNETILLANALCDAFKEYFQIHNDLIC